MQIQPSKSERKCVVCGSDSRKPLYRQQFSGLSDHKFLDGYVVTLCRTCGFAYANEIPDQAAFDEYYREMSKYEQQHSIGGGHADLARCEQTVRGLEPFLPGPHARILDIGCASGRLLGLLKERGYDKVLGVDPSPTCAKLAGELYGVEVLTHSVFDFPDWRHSFDLVTLVSVIEHIVDIDRLMVRLRDLLPSGGLLFIEHPDVTRFSCAANGPFQEFSLEHVNYFSPLSLANLLRHYDFVQVFSYRETRQFSQEASGPSASSVFRKDGENGKEVSYDVETEASLVEYILQSRKLDEAIQETIGKLAESGTPIVVWGVGTHTQRLMVTSRLKEANIQVFVDSNVRYHGKKLNGIPILAPRQLRGTHEPILISSQVFQKEIAQQIREDLKLDNQLIVLY